jgi:hypothetical protein
VTNLGGPVLESPTLISVTYPGDDLTAVLDAFTSSLPNSTYWTVGEEYGVGPGKTVSPVHLTTMAPSSIDDAQLQHDLPLELAAGTFGTVPADAIYVIYFPAGVQVTNAGQQGCLEFGGYHSSVTMPNGSLVAYAVIPRCSNLNMLSAQDATTSAASHEIMEAATDPYFENQKGAWGGIDAAHIGWVLFPGAEIGDLCLLTNDNVFKPGDLPFLVQRVWSNRAAAQSMNPCVPANTATPYFNSVPVLPDMVTLNLGSGSFQAQGISIPVSGEKTVPLYLFSDDATATWNLASQGLIGASGQLSITFDKTSGVNGDVVQMTVHVSQAGSFLSMQNIEPFVILSKLGSVIQAWPILVTNPS